MELYLAFLMFKNTPKRKEEQRRNQEKEKKVKKKKTLILKVIYIGDNCSSSHVLVKLFSISPVQQIYQSCSALVVYLSG